MFKLKMEMLILYKIDQESSLSLGLLSGEFWRGGGGGKEDTQ